MAGKEVRVSKFTESGMSDEDALRAAIREVADGGTVIVDRTLVLPPPPLPPRSEREKYGR